MFTLCVLLSPVLKKKRINFIRLGQLFQINVRSTCVKAGSVRLVSARFAKYISIAVRSSYFSNNPRIFFGARLKTTGEMSNYHIRSVIYQTRCQCVADYIGRTGQRLEVLNISQLDCKC